MHDAGTEEREELEPALSALRQHTVKHAGDTVHASSTAYRYF